MNSPIFQSPIDRKHLLKSLQIALSFTSPLPALYVQSIVQGFVKDTSTYLSLQLFRDWFIKQDGLVILSERSERFVRMCQFCPPFSKAGVSKQSYHELLLIRTLFLCLLHLDFSQIVTIRKQKHYQPRFIPDLTIVTKTQTLLIEVETGTQSTAIIEAKIRGLQAYSNNQGNHQFILIYFTNSSEVYNYFRQNFNQHGVQFIYLQSPNLAQDLLRLAATDTEGNTPEELNLETNNYAHSNVNHNVNTAKTADNNSDNTKTTNSTAAKAANSNSSQQFKPIDLTNPITSKRARKATIALAPNVFACDSSMVKKMLEPLPQGVSEAIEQINTLNQQDRTEIAFNQTISDTLLQMERDFLADSEEDFDDN